MSAADWWATGAFIVIGSGISALRERARQAKGLPPPEPVMDLPGQWTAPVRAVTPRGVNARQSRCCQFGHQTPGKAVAHAARIAGRIERTGR
jgi:hypothetical protein